MYSLLKRKEKKNTGRGGKIGAEFCFSKIKMASSLFVSLQLVVNHVTVSDFQFQILFCFVLFNCFLFFYFYFFQIWILMLSGLYLCSLHIFKNSPQERFQTLACLLHQIQIQWKTGTLHYIHTFFLFSSNSL